VRFLALIARNAPSPTTTAATIQITIIGIREPVLELLVVPVEPPPLPELPTE
jgi:hypothetical protein